MRESNFSNPLQNKASVCISAAIYDRRALDCSATLPLINSLNHLAYLTSTSPRIREMVCLDGGLERLIRILRQVPRSPSQPPMRGVITKEMQAVWKWSLAFQCVVNIGVRGSENVRTRVVEAGMVPVAVRVLESYLRIAEAIRDERKREARREEAKQRLERAAESALLAIDVATPTTNSTRRSLLEASARTPQVNNRALDQNNRIENSNLATTGSTDETRPTTPAEAMMGEFMISNSSSSSSLHAQDTDLPDVATAAAAAAAAAAVNSEDVAVADLTTIDAMAVENATLSPSSSASSVRVDGRRLEAPRSSENSNASTSLAGTSRQGPFPSGTLTNVSSVEDFTASGSGSDGAEDGDMEGGDDSDPGNVPMQRDQHSMDEQQMEDLEDRMTPRPPRRSLVPARDAEARYHTPAQTQIHRDTITAHSAGRQHSRPRPTINDQNSNVHATPIATAPQRGAELTQTPRNIASITTAPSHGTHPERGANHSTSRNTISTSERDPSHSHASDMIYREEEVLLSLQLLAYLSKYAHVRTLFHRDLGTLNALDPLEALDVHSRTDGNFVTSWSPSDPPKKNVFCVAERYTLRSSRTGLSQFASMGESRIAPEIQYWAGVIMRNACRKDEKQGGIRQCANMLCGKWEKQPREFAKCRRCRKAKYCSKQCQSKGWQMGHRFWCSARSDDEHGEGNKDRAKERSANTTANAVPADEANQTRHNLMENDTQPPPTDGTILGHHHHHQHHHHHYHHQNLAPHQMQGQPGEEGERVNRTVIAPHPIVRAASMGEAESVMRDTMTTEMEEDARSATEMAPLHVPRRGAGLPSSSSSSSSNPTLGRRAVSAIPQHLQPPSSSHPSGSESNALRSRTVSVASSSADVSDMSEDEMDRASRRVLASTVAPVLRSPAGVLTSLANVHTASADEEHIDRQELHNGTRGSPVATELQAEGGTGVPTRTDLAGRPLPPPVIASHDGRTSLDIDSAPDNDLLAIGGRLTPTAVDETEAGVFGRGDFDQMIWRGRTPSMEDQRIRSHPFAPSAGTSQNASASTSQENLDEQIHVHGRSNQEPSMLNSALFLAGQGEIATPRFPSSNLHAPVARQAHRFTSVNATPSSASSSTNGNPGAAYATVGPSSAVNRPLGDHWQPHGIQQSFLGSAPATAAISFAALQRRQNRDPNRLEGRNEHPFVVPADLQDLLDTAERRASASAITSNQLDSHQSMEID